MIRETYIIMRYNMVDISKRKQNDKKRRSIRYMISKNIYNNIHNTVPSIIKYC